MHIHDLEPPVFPLESSVDAAVIDLPRIADLCARRPIKVVGYALPFIGNDELVVSSQITAKS